MSGGVTAVPTPVEAVEAYYRLLDSGDLDTACQVFAGHAEVHFAHRPVLHGRDSMAGALGDLLAGPVQSTSHDTVRAYAVDLPEGATTVVCEQIVSHAMRLSGNQISCYVLSISEVDKDSGQITAQRVAADLRPVLADHEANG